MVYVYPQLSKNNFFVFRRCSTGLGNLLFCWARSIIFANKYNLKVISPTWFQLTFGPFIRFEKDKRSYLGLFKSHSDEIVFVEKLSVLLKAKKITEKDFFENIGFYTKSKEKYVISFTEMGDFNSIENKSSLISKYLKIITKNKHKKGLDFNFENSISIHVRKGDFLTTKQSTPDDFFIDIIAGIRKYIGGEIKVYIFTDASDKDCSKLLTSIPNSEKLSFGSSIADILALSNSNILIGSKNSTFSWWAGFIGQIPMIWPNGTKIKIKTIENSKEVIVDNFEGLPVSFKNKLNIRFKN